MMLLHKGIMPSGGDFQGPSWRLDTTALETPNEPNVCYSNLTQKFIPHIQCPLFQLLTFIIYFSFLLPHHQLDSQENTCFPVQYCLWLGIHQLVPIILVLQSRQSELPTCLTSGSSCNLQYHSLEVWGGGREQKLELEAYR